MYSALNPCPTSSGEDGSERVMDSFHHCCVGRDLGFDVAKRCDRFLQTKTHDDDSTRLSFSRPYRSESFGMLVQHWWNLMLMFR